MTKGTEKGIFNQLSGLMWDAPALNRDTWWGVVCDKPLLEADIMMSRAYHYAKRLAGSYALPGLAIRN
jgi:hypothetical protein